MSATEQVLAKLDQIDKKVGDHAKVIEELKKPVYANGNPAKLYANPRDHKEENRWGWKDIGEIAHAVKRHALGQGTDKRLEESRVKAPTNYMNESVGADGGYLIAPDFLQEIMRYTFNEEALLPLTRQITTSGNTITVPKDETTPWGTDGVQVYWLSEAAVKPDSKPKLGEVNLTLHKMAALVPVSDEMLEDSFIALGQYLRDAVSARIREKTNAAIVAGTGAGQPLGFKNSGALVTVAKEAAQAADTFVAANAAKMYATLPSDSMNNAVWLHHSTVFPQLVTMVLGEQPVWLAGNRTIEGRPFSTLFGARTMFSEQCEILGDKGDVYLADLRQYLTVTKSTGIQEEMSIHLYFDRDLTAFRFVFRMAGMPWPSAPITQKKGGGQLSPFVTLEARA